MLLPDLTSIQKAHSDTTRNQKSTVNFALRLRVELSNIRLSQLTEFSCCPADCSRSGWITLFRQHESKFHFYTDPHLVQKHFICGAPFKSQIDVVPLLLWRLGWMSVFQHLWNSSGNLSWSRRRINCRPARNLPAATWQNDNAHAAHVFLCSVHFHVTFLQLALFCSTVHSLCKHTRFVDVYSNKEMSFVREKAADSMTKYRWKKGESGNPKSVQTEWLVAQWPAGFNGLFPPF